MPEVNPSKKYSADWVPTKLVLLTEAILMNGSETSKKITTQIEFLF
jgi:hypothetical protein